MRVLHVDNVDWILKVHKALLDVPGLELVSCRTLKGAKRALDEEGLEFDIILIDGYIYMTQDGLQWAQKLSTQGRKVIVLVSFRGSGQDIPFLDKRMFDPEALQQLIRE